MRSSLRTEAEAQEYRESLAMDKLSKEELDKRLQSLLNEEEKEEEREDQGEA